MTAKDRILLISTQPFFQWRGSPIRVKFNVTALARAGYQVDLLTLPIGDNIKIEGVTIHRVTNPFRFRQVLIGPSMKKAFFDLLLLIKGFQLCRRYSYTIIHGVEEAGMLATILANHSGAYSIYEKHSDPSSYRGGALKNIILRLYANYERIAARRADAVIGTGPGLVKQVQDMQIETPVYNIPDIPSSLCDPTPESIQSVREKYNMKPEEVWVTYVGSFATYQGLDLLFDVIPRVLNQRANVRFMIIGGTPKQIENEQSTLEQRGVGQEVVFAGKIPPDKLPSYLAASDCLLSMRSSGINTPLKILDYMKAGRAIVATDVPANRLLLDESRAMLSSPNVSDFTESIVTLVNNADLRKQIGEQARIQYEQNYTFEHLQARLATCYQQVKES